MFGRKRENGTTYAQEKTMYVDEQRKRFFWIEQGWIHEWEMGVNFRGESCRPIGFDKFALRGEIVLDEKGMKELNQIKEMTRFLDNYRLSKERN